jgi:hypothetical protein
LITKPYKELTEKEIELLIRARFRTAHFAIIAPHIRRLTPAVKSIHELVLALKEECLTPENK